MKHWITPDGSYYEGEHVAEGSIPITEEDYNNRPLSVPQQVPRRQGLQALHLRGHLSQVPAIIAAIPDPDQRALAQIEFDESLYFERHRQMVLYVGAQLGLNSVGLDELFIFASTL